MSQHDLDIANQGFPATRADLNNALKALGSLQSGATAPSTTYANMLWYDTANNILKIRNEDNDAFISLFTLDQTNDDIAALTINGTLTADGLSVDGSTIKLDGNYPTGTNNVALGDAALGGGSLSGGSNVAIGTSALDANTSGTTNIAIGVNALGANTTASDNVAIGHSALKVSTTGTRNVAVGYEALDANSTASDNTALGYNALGANTTGNGLVAVGGNALDANTTGADATAVGYNALSSVTTANGNTAVGTSALAAVTGAYNTAIGSGAGVSMTTGAKNTIIGGFQGNQDGLDMRTLSNYIVLSDGDGNRRITVRNDGTVGIKDAAFVANGVAQVNVPAAGVAIINADTNGHYRWNYQSSDQSMYWSNGSNQASLSSAGTWTDASDVAYKKDITDATYGIDTVKAMQPRFYYMKDDAIEDDGRQLGFIAQELEAVVPEVVSGEDGSKGVSYGHLTAVLTKALQEAVAKIETLETKVAALEAE